MNYNREERIYHKGFRDGWDAAIDHHSIASAPQSMTGVSAFTRDIIMEKGTGKRKPRKRPASKKQKLLKTMTDKKWKTYKGKKTWIQIRAQVSRSQAYKKKSRRL